KALPRIKIPQTITNLIIDIITNRHNTVITNHGTTELEHTDYTMYTTVTTNNRIHKIEANHSVLAYIDDTTWIVLSKQQLKAILNTATIFYSFTNIQVNPNKSVLATLNPTDTPSILFNGSNIESIKHKQAFRFLGC
ncbi:10543_t:CDS:2, partial [Ambispora leptoticha]